MKQLLRAMMISFNLWILKTLLWTCLDIILISKDTLLQKRPLSAVSLKTSRSETTILYAVNQLILFPLETLLKINFYSLSMEKTNKLNHLFLAEMKRQKDEKGSYLSRFHCNRNYRVWLTFLFLMTSIQCFVYLSREIFFLPRHVCTCRRRERKYCDIVKGDVWDV